MQKIVMKDWLRFREHQKNRNKVSCHKVNCVYILPRVFSDASQDCTGVTEYKVCLNALYLLFNYGYKKLKKLKDDLHNALVEKHKLCGKVPNNIKNMQARYADMYASLDNYFSGLTEEAKHHASPIVRKWTGVGLRDTEANDIFLPPSYTKRQLYYKWLYKCGYVVKANAKGNTPHLVKDFKVREFDELDWPAGSVPLPVCSRSYFQKFWKSNYKNLKLRQP